jgi:hypothetical protein
MSRDYMRLHEQVGRKRSHSDPWKREETDSTLCRVSGSYSSGYEEFRLLG